MPHLWNNVLLASICCALIGLYVVALPYENEYGPDYGSSWFMHLNDNGSTSVVNFSTLPIDERGFLWGDVYFRLYTKLNDIAETMEVPDDGSTIHSRYYNNTNCLLAFTHGWLGSEDSGWLQNTKNASLKNTDCNIIVVDWSELAENPIYPWAALCTRYVGKKLAKLLDALIEAYQIDKRHIHLIGHSLGAQVMGYAGLFCKIQVNRITGLDPARPLYEMPEMGDDYRLEKSDALYVDIIHTCGGIYGYLRSNGHADFYPNDGRARQPGCEGPQEMIEGCSHGRSCEFFGESITSTGFVAYPCESWEKFERGECNDNSTLMGYPASTDREGDFFLYTRDESPYAIG